MLEPSPHYIVSLQFKGRELGSWKVDGEAIKIGRTAENHIAIDNLSVSRLHAIIEAVDGTLTIRDCDSLNGIEVNHVRVKHAALTHGDVITIGKHQIVCRIAGPDGRIAADPALFEKTMFAPADRPGPVANPGMLVETSPDRARHYALDRGLIILGSDEAADVVIRGRNIAPYHAEIRLLDGVYTLRHLDGRARVRVDGEPVKERALADGCSITVGDFSFMFHATADVANPRG
ncbi:MAG TPA: FHA domain-containing protein [Candidatus Krumholzibacteria bacterium]|nr:FHA domain-containing protein [Candidatus Krumholzibacteria bacterium]